MFVEVFPAQSSVFTKKLAPTSCLHHNYMVKRGWYFHGKYLKSCHIPYCPVHGRNFCKRVWYTNKERIPYHDSFYCFVIHLNKHIPSKDITSIINSFKKAIQQLNKQNDLWAKPHYDNGHWHLHCILYITGLVEHSEILTVLDQVRKNCINRVPEMRLSEDPVHQCPESWLWYVLKCSKDQGVLTSPPKGGRYKFGWGIRNPPRPKKVNNNEKNIPLENSERQTDHNRGNDGELADRDRTFQSLDSGECPTSTIRRLPILYWVATIYPKFIHEFTISHIKISLNNRNQPKCRSP